MRALAVVLVVGGCGRYGFEPLDGDGAGGDADQPRVTFQVDVLLFAQLSTCVIGDMCAGSGCIELDDDTGNPVVSFRDNASFAAVLPGDPRIASAAVSQCMTTTLDESELTVLRAAADQLAANVAAWSADTMALDVRIHELSTPATMSVFGGLWLSQSDIQALAPGILSSASDFVLAIHDIRDDGNGLHLPAGYCGLTIGAEFGPAGSGYSWIPRTMSVDAFECASASSFTYQVLLQLDFVLQGLVSFPDLYAGAYPACGAGDPDPHRWFPSPGSCMTDPDWTECGVVGCGADPFDQHILERHWVPGSATIGNHCRDGVTNFGETDVDVGGMCL